MAKAKPDSEAAAMATGPGDGQMIVVGGVSLPPALAEYKLFDKTSMEIFRENLAGENLDVNDLLKIKTPAGGGTAWSIPTIEGEEDIEKEIQGIIVAVRNTRAYWENEYDGSKAKPNCSSEDAIMGVGEPGGPCATCPMAQWESDPKGGAGQACKKVQLLFIAIPGNNLPIIIPVAPGSLATVKKYLLGLANKSIKYSHCVTSFKLEKAVSSGGITFSKITPSLSSKIPGEFLSPINDFINENKESFNRVQLNRDDLQ